MGKTITNMNNIVAAVGEGEEPELTEDEEKKRREENELRWATAAEGVPKEEEQREVSVEKEKITEPALPSMMAVPTVKMPTEAQQRQHMLTHVPYSDWCAICVEACGKDDPHRRQVGEGPPVIEVDYSFMRTSEPNDKLATVLIAYNKQRHYGFGCVAQKWPMDQYAINSLVRWLKEHGLASGMIRLRTDSEVSIRAVAAAVAAMRPQGGTLVEVSPVNSSSSLGGVERWSQTLTGHVRALVLDAGRRLGRKLTAVSALYPWAVRHANFLHNRLQPQQHGATPFEQIQHREYKSQMLPFASSVLMRQPAALEQAKLEPRWTRGLWLGRRTESDEHIVGTQEGIFASRTVQLMQNEPTQEMVLDGMIWTPSYQRPTADEEMSEKISRPTPAARMLPSSKAPANRRKAAVELHTFQDKCGRTEGCGACMYGADGRSHSTACWARRRRWIDEGQPRAEDAPPEEEKQDVSMPGEEIAPRSKRGHEGGEMKKSVRKCPEPQGRRRKAEEQAGSAEHRAKVQQEGTKRGRDREMEEYWADDEEKARGAGRDDLSATWADHRSSTSTLASSCRRRTSMPRWARSSGASRSSRSRRTCRRVRRRMARS